MRQIVLLKDIPDLTEIKLDPQTRAPIVEGVKRRISEVDKRALEAAIRLKEKVGGEVVTLSLGDDKTKTALLEALAMGADAAYIVNEPELKGVDTNATSKVLEAAVKHVGDYDLIIAGEMTLDSLSSQIGPRLAQLLDLPQITYVKELDVADGKVRAVRDLEDVDEVVEAALPAVVCVVREINEARIPNLMSIMKAKKKPQTVWGAGDIGLDASEVKSQSYVQITSVFAPKVERKQIKIEAETVEEAAVKLVEALMQEGVL
ncbi:MAG TPA: electron transfer flavoprotein subunit beta/FixA family protein [Candidatus Krumholzibacteriaceae bacterium]|nr:electron transfer flavoprotein subunit beta/FixA family protein [Candidatus Krumholzibacteriaceae bacterium]